MCHKIVAGVEAVLTRETLSFVRVTSEDSHYKAFVLFHDKLTASQSRVGRCDIHANLLFDQRILIY